MEQPREYGIWHHKVVFLGAISYWTHTTMVTMTMPWGEMAYHDSGSRMPPLLFLHGTGCDASDWIPVTKNLARNQRCIALDFRGHGQSSVPTQPLTLGSLAEDVGHLANHLGFHELVIVGHSLGGMVAMEVARRSSSVVGLVLLEGWSSLSSAGSAFDAGRFYGSLSQTTITQIQRKAEATRSRFQAEIWHDFWESVKDFDAYTYLQRAGIAILEVFGGMGRNDLTEQQLHIPPNPNIQWVWVPNAGHYLPHECPIEVAKVIGALRRHFKPPKSPLSGGL
ncbi:MAG: alpha/beta hydrolase [Candidatus Poribacteria bacterium]|nr:alpha/beta hydrolase [Candidatus Poribacteria bacterium]